MENLALAHSDGDFDDSDALRVAEYADIGPNDLILGLLEQTDDCVKLIDRDGRLEFINCGGLRVMEIDNAAEIIGKEWWTLWPPVSRKLVRRQFSSALSGETTEFVGVCPTRNGRHKLWSVRLKPMIASAGHVVSVLCTSKDITQA